MNLLLSKFENVIGDNEVLKFRRRNVDFWLSHITDIVRTMLNTIKFATKVEVVLTDPKRRASYNGFSLQNIKILKIGVKFDNQMMHVRNVYLPVPDRNDMFIVNGNYYVMVNRYSDTPAVIYNNSCRIKNFLFVKDKKVKVVNNHYLKTVFLLALNVIDRNNIEVIKLSKKLLKEKKVGSALEYYEQLKNQHGEDAVILTRNEKYIIVIHDPIVNTSFYKELILPELQKLARPTDVLNTESYDKCLKMIKEMTLGSYHTFMLGYPVDTPIEIVLKNVLIDIIYNRFDTERFDKFYTLRQKRVMYYDSVIKYLLDMLDLFVSNINQRKTPPNNLHIDSNLLTKWLIASNPVFQFQSIKDFNILRDLNLKETIYLVMEHPADAYRNIDASIKYYVDPINTPDDSKIGLVQRLANTAKLDKLGFFLPR